MASRFEILPAWAKKFNFTHHSVGEATDPNSIPIFKKVIARPRKLKNRVGCEAVGGNCAATYAKNVAIEGMPESEAFSHAVATFDEHEPLPWLSNDAVKLGLIRADKYQAEDGHEGTLFELTLKHTLEGLREAAAGANQIIDVDYGSDDCRTVNVRLKGLELDFLGYMDAYAAGLIEIKTKWIQVDKSEKNKRGWKVNSIPKTPDYAHIMQVALYWRYLREQDEQVPVRLVYANNKGFRVFRSEDCEQLQPASLEAALTELRKIAHAREELLRNADDQRHLLRMIPPDFGHWKWRRADPEYRAVAEREWEMAFD